MLAQTDTEKVIAILSLGNADLPARPRHGNSAMIAGATMIMVKVEGQHLLGLQAVGEVTITAATTNVLAVTVHHRAVLLHGNASKMSPLHPRVDNRATDMVPTQAEGMVMLMAATVNQAWELLPASVVDLAAWVLLPD